MGFPRQLVMVRAILHYHGADTGRPVLTSFREFIGTMICRCFPKAEVRHFPELSRLRVDPVGGAVFTVQFRPNQR